VERIIRDSQPCKRSDRANSRLVKNRFAADWLNINDAVLEVIALARSEMNMNRVRYKLNSRIICRPYAQIEFSFNK